MQSFKDNAGRSWSVQVTVDGIRRVRALTGVDLMEAVSGPLIQKLAEDPVTLCDILFALLKPDADTQGVSDEDFGRSMAGDVIADATDAFLDALTDFFPKAKSRLLKKALGKMRIVQKRALEAADKALENPKLMEEVESRLAKSGDLLAIWPADSDSTLDDSPSEN